MPYGFLKAVNDVEVRKSSCLKSTILRSVAALGPFAGKIWRIGLMGGKLLMPIM